MNFKRIAGDVGKIFAGNVVATVVSALQGIFIAKWLGPAEFGRWNLLLVVVTYNLNSHFGILNGLSKEAPRFRGTGDEASARGMLVSAFWACVLLSVFAASVAICCAAIPTLRAFEGRDVFLLLALILPANNMYIYYLTALRVDERFKLLGAGVALQAILTFACILMLRKAQMLSLLTSATAVLIGYVVPSLLMMGRTEYHRSVYVDRRLVRMMVVSGIPLTGISIFNSILLTADRWVLASSVARTEFGYYALGVSGAVSLALIPSSLAFVIFPRLMRLSRETEDRRNLIPWLRWPFVSSLVLMSAVVGMVVLLLPWAFSWFLPSYLPSIPVVTALLTGALVIALLPVVGNMLISLDLHRPLLIFQGISIVLMVGGGRVLMRQGMGVMGMAVFSMSVRAALLVVLMGSAYRALKVKAGSVAEDAAFALVSIAGLLVLVGDRFVSPSRGTPVWAIVAWAMSLSSGIWIIRSRRAVSTTTAN